ncbi:glutamyl-tRNA reductase [Alkaliphilus crotonatoxidans]
MNLVVFGVTHKSSTIGLREKVAFTKSKLERAYEAFNQDPFIKEAIIISTCNRSEVFALVADSSRACEYFKGFYQDFFKLTEIELKGQYHFLDGKLVVTYLYNVCCGFDSLVLGEDQILGQVKEAYYFGMEEGSSGKVLNRLFLEAISTAKEIKAKTGISNNPLSISTIAVKQIERQVGSLTDKRVLVIGFGKMSRIAIENLIDKNIKEIYLCNRTRETVEKLQKSYQQIQYCPFEERYHLINKVDVIISATGAPHYVLRQEAFQKSYKGKGSLCIVDIALPRDVEPSIGEIKGVTLFHIDQLNEIAKESMAFRKQCVGEAAQSIQEAVEEYCNWYRCLPIYSRIEAIKSYSDRLTQEELERLFKKLPHVEDRDKGQIEQVVKSLIKKIWRRPILQMKNAGIGGRGEEVAAIVDELFDFHNTKN